MKAAEIRQRFLEYFERNGHTIRPSASLVPSDDPTLLFTNAGMVPFKRVFLGSEEVPWSRATTSQKCVRAGGKHNDLEEVGRTARHHTFFEMLGNFSFGDYFKSGAVAFAWEFLTVELGIDPQRLVVTVHHTDDEAERLWIEEVGVDPSRIFRLGDRDNFWQMADTGPCGPCSELHYDLRAEELRTQPLDRETFVELGESGEFVELWNLVFMQFDRDSQGELHPLPAPSIDTGAGLERIAAILQGEDNNFHTDLFAPLLNRVGEVVGRPYDRLNEDAVSYRVLADHARAVAFLLADGVFPSNDGRGYVLRRILRRAVRHAWLLGRREPTLISVVEQVVETMSPSFPELDQRRDHLLRTTRAEEERFLATIEGGLSRFEELTPAIEDGPETGGPPHGVVPGDEAFKLHDTFGFPLDLTELMARERGYEVDVAGFEAALAEQRQRSRDDRAAHRPDLDSDPDSTLEGWTVVEDADQSFVGYEARVTDTALIALRQIDSRVELILTDNPFYLESGGQVSDIGVVSGEGWSVTVDQVRRVAGRTAVSGLVEGTAPTDGAGLTVRAEVRQGSRHDTERNHTATHLLHAALRAVLGEHVVQRGSLVASDRLRFDFAHTHPMTADDKAEVERRVNRAIWEDHSVDIRQMSYRDAVKAGAMALFGEKYGDEVRVVQIPDVSMELCGGTHVRRTSEIGLFRLVSESGVAAGVRRIEARTGPGAFALMSDREEELEHTASILRAPIDRVADRATQLLEERDRLEKLIDELRQSGGGGEQVLVSESVTFGGTSLELRGVRLTIRDADDARGWGDGFLASEKGVAVAATTDSEGKFAMFAFASDEAIGMGIRADAVIREVASIAGGRGGGRPHMAQAGIGEPDRIEEALRAVPSVVRDLAGGEG